MAVRNPLLYLCCDVAAEGSIWDPCWYCQQEGMAVRPRDLPDDHSWNLFRRTARKQSGTTTGGIQ